MNTYELENDQVSEEKLENSEQKDRDVEFKHLEKACLSKHDLFLTRFVGGSGFTEIDVWSLDLELLRQGEPILAILLADIRFSSAIFLASSLQQLQFLPLGFCTE